MGVCNCSMFCCTLLCVHSSIAIILMGKRELVALLNWSSWCLVMVERLFLAVPQGCLQFVIVVFPDHTHLLFLGSLSGDWKLQQRARAATERQDRYLWNLALRNRHVTARGLRNDLQLATEVHVSNQTQLKTDFTVIHYIPDALPHFNRSSPHRQANFCPEPRWMAIGPVAHSTVDGRKLFPCMHV